MSTHAYVFAHRSLPLLVFTEPAKALPVLAGPDAESFLTGIWQSTGEQVEPGDRRPAEGLRVSVSPTGTTGVVIAIGLPAPEEAGEAHLAAIFARFANPAQPDLGQLAWVRYFTLEKGVHPVNETTCTMLCEWTEDAKHKNYGEGPPPDEQLFIESVIEKLWSEKERAAREAAEAAAAGSPDEGGEA